jgi:glucosamine-phosphate N-acetyltransferase
VGVYFEQNGHGNVLFQSLIQEIDILTQFFHPVIGDGVMDLFATLYILQVLKWDVQDWMNIYTEYPSKLSKCSVLDKNVFKSTENELELIQPLYLQRYIHKFCTAQPDSCRAFVRASGTENALRLYVESIDQATCEYVHTNISEFIDKRINNEAYILKIEKYHMIKNETFWMRPITRNDLNESYYKLLGQLTKIDPETMDSNRSDTFFRDLGQTHQIHVIEHCKTNKVVATGTLFVEQKLIRNYGKVGHIEDIVVDEAYRGYGLGKIMIKNLSDIGKDLQCYKCILDCDDKHTGFYEKCGYIRKGAEMSKYM